MLLMIFSLWSISLSSAQKLHREKSSVELRYHEPTLTVDQLEKMQQEEDMQENRLVTSMVGWGQIPQVVLENESLDRTAKSALIYVFGNLRTLIPQGQISGEWVEVGDEQGALVSRKVAHDLWGSLDVIGKTFIYDKKEYCVRGVIAQDVPVMMVQASKQSDEALKFSQLKLQLIDSENILRKVEVFRGRYGLTDTTTVNLSLTSIVLGQIVYLPMWLLGGYGIFKLLKHLSQFLYHGKKGILWLFGSLVLIAILIKLMVIQFEIPAYLIPNKWSDFAFWSKLGESLRANYLEVQSLPKYLPDMWRMALQRMLLVTLGISCILTIWGMRRLTIKEHQTLFLKTVIAIIASFLVIVIGDLVGVSASYPQAFWVMLPLVMGSLYMTHSWQDFMCETIRRQDTEEE
ncbi:MAG: hypothetical protein ACRCW2_06395 [Cellulosilyticaceae bacterium]